MRRLIVALPLLLAGCVPDEVHEADQQRIAELLAHVAELQNQVASLLASQRVLEIVCVVNGLLVAICITTVWLRARKKGGPS